MKTLSIAITGSLLCLFSTLASASTLSDSGIQLPGVDWSCLAWGDFDNDGRLDLLITGTTNGFPSGAITQLWRNTGAGFVKFPLTLPGVTSGAVSWGDYDNDGRLDILIAGYTGSSPIAQVWRNTGNGFTNISAGLPGVSGGWDNSAAVAWGDYDNDGRLDIALSGDTGNGYIAQIWRNTGTGFTNINAGLQGVFAGALSWGDYDNDGRLDLLITGAQNPIRPLTDPVTQLWHNTGTRFEQIPLPSRGVYHSCASWGDFNNDGRLDFLICGEGETFVGPYFVDYWLTEIWTNTGSTFGLFSDEITPATEGSVVWGDYDNDGRVDVLRAADYGGANPLFELWRNLGSGFTNVQAFTEGVNLGASAAWGDYDNDGRLDCVVAGMFSDYSSGSSTLSTILYHNTGGTSNSPPSAPTNLTAQSSYQSALLSWKAANDARTPSAGLSYNVRVGRTPGGSEVVNPMSSATGRRRLPALGNAQLRTNLSLTHLIPGRTYYWSVQAVDNGFAGGPFAPEQTFSTPVPGPQPPAQTLEIGSDARFDFKPFNSEPLAYQWLFNSGSPITGATGSVLRLSQVQANQAGNYSLRITGSFGSVTSPPAALNLVTPVPRRMVPGLLLRGQAGDTNQLEATDVISASAWAPLALIGMTNTSQWSFDLADPLFSERFYRAELVSVGGQPPFLDVHMVPAITLTGVLGSSVRLDYVNQVGPTNAWVTLATVRLDTSPKLYFDTSSVGQPARVYRRTSGP